MLARATLPQIRLKTLRGIGAIVAQVGYIISTPHHAESTMAKTATTRARIEPTVKAKAEKILSECGLSPSPGISLFYRQVILHRGLPFTVQSYNARTHRVLKKSEKGVSVREFDSPDALFKDLGL